MHESIRIKITNQKKRFKKGLASRPCRNQKHLILNQHYYQQLKMAVFLPRDSLFRDFDRLLNAQLNAMTSTESNTDDANQISSKYWGGSFNARLDLTENEKGYIVHADLPGVKKDEVNITIKDNILTISGERNSKKETKDDQRHIVERSFGKFSRSVRLPNDANADAVTATMDHGVLELTLLKKALDEGVKKINV
ncbi:HSP20-like chaperone, partial [Obelidium mucronatum]